MSEQSDLATVDLSQFKVREYDPGGSFLLRAAWFALGLPLFRSSLLPFSSFRRWLLKCFGARIGAGVVIKPGARVKYPWKLRVGDNSWIGEDAWIDNIAPVTLGNNVCLSQGVYLCTGNHNWRDRSFGLIARPIVIEDGAWIAAQAAIAPGITIGRSAVVGLGAVVLNVVPPGEIHTGNPATFVRHREI